MHWVRIGCRYCRNAHACHYNLVHHLNEKVNRFCGKSSVLEMHAFYKPPSLGWNTKKIVLRAAWERVFKKEIRFLIQTVFPFARQKCRGFPLLLPARTSGWGRRLTDALLRRAKLSIQTIRFCEGRSRRPSVRSQNYLLPLRLNVQSAKRPHSR